MKAQGVCHYQHMGHVERKRGERKRRGQCGKNNKEVNLEEDISFFVCRFQIFKIKSWREILLTTLCRKLFQNVCTPGSRGACACEGRRRDWKSTLWGAVYMSCQASWTVFTAQERFLTGERT